MSTLLAISVGLAGGAAWRRARVDGWLEAPGGLGGVGFAEMGWSGTHTWIDLRAGGGRRADVYNETDRAGERRAALVGGGRVELGELELRAGAGWAVVRQRWDADPLAYAEVFRQPGSFVSREGAAVADVSVSTDPTPQLVVGLRLGGVAGLLAPAPDARLVSAEALLFARWHPAQK